MAILFICEVDNICFNVALSERARSRVEIHGRVQLDENEVTTLVRSKVIHAVLLVAVFLVVVALKGNSE
eukprot:SAG31_NODE_40682_length_279_cov_1.127778_1_plen_68_part_10